MTTSIIRAGGTGVPGVQTTAGNDGALALKVGPLAATVEALNIDASGNVGIGTTAPANKLHVVGAAASNNLSVRIDNTDASGYASLQLGGTDGGVYRNGSSQTGYAGASSLNLITVGAHNIGFSTSNTLRMTVASGGNVGIGTAAPASQLHIVSAAGPADDLTMLTLQNGNGTGDISTPDTWIDFVFKDANDNVTPQARIGAHAGTGGDANSLPLEGSGYLTFHTSGTTASTGDLDPPERMRIDSAGRVTMPNQPHWHGTITGTTGTGIADSAATQTSRGGLTFSNSRVTVPIAGVYSLHFNTISDTSTARIDANILVNGTSVLNLLNEDNGTGYHQKSGSLNVLLAANDYVTFNNNDWYAATTNNTIWKTASVTLIS